MVVPIQHYEYIKKVIYIAKSRISAGIFKKYKKIAAEHLTKFFLAYATNKLNCKSPLSFGFYNLKFLT